MWHCHDGASICLHYLISREWSFFWAFQIRLWLVDSLSWRNKFFVDDSLFIKKSNQLWFNFRFVHSSFLWSRRVCGVPLFTLPFGLRIIFKNPCSSLVVTRPKKSCSLAILSRRSRHLFFRICFCSIVFFRHHFGTDISHVQMFSQNLMNS